jgi:hypothetical protein
VTTITNAGGIYMPLLLLLMLLLLLLLQDKG